MSLAEAPTAPPSPPDDHDALKAGARVGEFIIERVLGVGGFGIVYLAVDQVLLRQVAVKEYMPTALAGRGAGGRIVLRSPSHRDAFDEGLRSFVNEARMLASFDHPALVKVHRFWEDQGTAYMVMPYYEGQTLSHRRFVQAGPVDDARLRAFIDPLLDALDQLHRSDVFHRDIAPDNILLLPDGRPVLLDFGAARRVISDRTQSLTAVLKPSFAPVEQYGDVPGMRQGPWTDLYALGAVVHHLITGQMPPPAVVRAVRDAMPALSEAAPGRWPLVGLRVRSAVDWALAVVPDDRPRSVQDLRDALDGALVPPRPTPRVSAADPEPAAPARGAWSKTVRVPPAKSEPPPARRAFRTASVAALALAGLLAVGGWLASREPGPPAAPAPAVPDLPEVRLKDPGRRLEQPLR